MSTDWDVPADPPPPSRVRRSAVIYGVMGVLLLGLLACGGVVGVYVIPHLGAAKAAAKQSRAESQLGTIGVALASYHARYKQFPAAYTVDAKGRPLLSWRVALLPFLGERELHSQFDQGKPWDSPANRLLLNKMPEVYRAAFSPVGRASGETAFATLRDPGSVFPGDEAVSYSDCTRGRQRTIAVVVAADVKLLWTKPDDLGVESFFEVLQAAGDDLPRPMGVMLDGSVETFSAAVTREAFAERVARSAEPVSPGGGEQEPGEVESVSEEVEQETGGVERADES